ncbi:MAG: 3-methylitaconate isomerase [Streptosporangiales bacterium]|nr:3-methylitaconate isomerase [Streptosporangiales bacterium]
MNPPGLPAVLMRGGTSKGVFVHTRDVPPAGPERDAVVLAVMGSPDPMQIDGLGGTYSSTSKLVVVEPGVDGDDVTYWFAQVGVDRPVVDWSGNCGNLTSAVGPFAIDEGLVEAVEPVTTVRLRNGNTGVAITAEVQVRDGRARYDGEHVVPGVPRPGAPVVTRYLDPGGSVFGTALPTGGPTAVVPGPHGDVEVSVVDVAHPMAFVPAKALGVTVADASPPELNRDPELLRRLEWMRGACAVALGRVDDPQDAAERSAIVPRLVLLGEPVDDGHDIAAVGVSMGAVHHALPMTAALCLGAAVRLPGTVAAGTARPVADETVRIRHPKGVVDVLADVASDSTVRSVGAVRTARRLMSGTVHLPG